MRGSRTIEHDVFWMRRTNRFMVRPDLKQFVMTMHSITRFCFVAVMLSLPLSGCGVLIGAGAAAGTASMQERGLGGVIDDKLIQAKINSNWLNVDSNLFFGLSSEVHEGRVLLTGSVAKPEHRVNAVRIAWQVDGVREVINQIEIKDRSGLVDYARDAWITSKLIFKLTVDGDIKAINYSLDTVNGHVFIMGIAQDRVERDRVGAHAQDVGYVRRVTNYAVLKNDPSRPLKVIIPATTK
jgi:osmotically-inducible protein OsmY